MKTSRLAAPATARPAEFELVLLADVAVDVAVPLPTTFVQLTLEGMAKLSESVKSVHCVKHDDP